MNGLQPAFSVLSSGLSLLPSMTMTKLLNSSVTKIDCGMWVYLCWVLLWITRVSPYPSIFSLIANLTPGWGTVFLPSNVCCFCFAEVCWSRCVDANREIVKIVKICENSNKKINSKQKVKQPRQGKAAKENAGENGWAHHPLTHIFPCDLTSVFRKKIVSTEGLTGQFLMCLPTTLIKR